MHEAIWSKGRGAWRVTVGSALLGLAMLALVASSAQAKPVKITGGEATFAPSAKLSQALSDNGITASAIDPATLDGSGNLTLPIARGAVRGKSLHGVLAMKGGVELSKGDHSLKLHGFVVVNRAKGGFVTAKVRGHRVRVARLTNRSADPSNGTAEADVRLSKVAAHRINKVAGKHVVSAGALLGHGTVAVTTG